MYYPWASALGPHCQVQDNHGKDASVTPLHGPLTPLPAPLLSLTSLFTSILGGLPGPG